MRFKPLLLWLSSGVLTGSAIIFPPLWFLVGPGLLLQLYLLRGGNFPLLGPTIAGTVHMAFSLLWLFGVVDISWLGFTSPIILGFVVVGVWVTSSFTAGLGYGVVLWSLRYIVGQHWLLYTLFPLALLGGELLGSFFLSVYSWSADSPLGVMFGFGYVGYTLVEHTTFRYAAIFGGVYALSIVWGTIVSCLYGLAQKIKDTKGVRSAIVFIVCLYVLFYASSFLPFLLRKEVFPSDIFVTSTNFSMSTYADTDRWNIAQEAYMAMVREVSLRSGKVVILPEDTRFLLQHTRDQLEAQLDTNALSQLEIIDTGRDEYEGQTVLRAMVYDPVLQKIFEYDKQYLVPFGEQIPVLPGLLMQRVGLGYQLQTLKSYYGYHPGITRAQANVPKFIPPVLFCYESIVPYMVHALMRTSDTTYVAHVVSHAWFSDQYGFLKNQLYQMLRVQALWNNVYIYQAANEAPAAVFTPNGNGYIAPALAPEELWKVYSIEDVVFGG